MFASLSNFLTNAGFFPGKNLTWRPEHDMPDMSGKVVLVTGANTGIGYESIKYLLKQGAKVYGLSRTPAKGEEAIKSLNALGYKGEAIFVRCDLADLTSVRSAAEELLAKEKQINVLFCNAGVMNMTHQGSDVKTAQGHEIQAGTNCLGHQHLIQLLRPALVEAASQSEKGSVRIIVSSSSGHFILTTKAMLNNWDLSDEASQKYKPEALYARSKLANIHQARKFADELESQGIIVASLHPGNIQSDLQRNLAGVQKAVISLLLWPVYYGCISQLYAGTAKDEGLQRAYLVPWAKKAEPHSSALDKAKIEKTWAWLEEQRKDF